MKLDYNPKDDSVAFTIGDADIEVQFNLLEFLNALPKNIEIVRLHYLLSQLHALRSQKIRNSEDYHQKILDLLEKEQNARNEQERCIEKGDLKRAKAYGELVKSILSEKNTANELRHNNRLLGIEEGKLMAMLAKLEV